MTLRLAPDAAPEPTYVPDGAPCPKHGLPTRLLMMPHIGLYSQCQGCIEAFLDWHYRQHIEIRVQTPDLKNRNIADSAISAQYEVFA